VVASLQTRSVTAEAVDRVVDAPKLAEHQESALERVEAFCPVTVTSRIRESLDVAEHVAVWTGESPQLIVHLHHRNAGADERSGGENVVIDKSESGHERLSGVNPADPMGDNATLWQASDIRIEGAGCPRLTDRLPDSVCKGQVGIDDLVRASRLGQDNADDHDRGTGQLNDAESLTQPEPREDEREDDFG
jgi:hypothetical protein